MSNFLLQNSIQSNCSLGEGLYLKESSSLWVDINQDKLFVYKDSHLKEYFLEFKPSVILNLNKNIVTIGTDIGIVDYDLNLNKYSITNGLPDFVNVDYFRSNDGCVNNSFILLGFMNRDEPNVVPGYIYTIKNGNWILIDSTIHIPNSFIEIERNKFLITDSLSATIWLFKFTDDGSLIEKKLWKKFVNGSTPDGGCMIGDSIFLSMWDGASITILNKDCELLDTIDLPVIRPTNCKFNPESSELWVTSASEGLSPNLLQRYNQSGNTFMYKLI